MLYILIAVIVLWAFTTYNSFIKLKNRVEKEKLETMVLNNPNYFYDILPFTYVLGVSEKWIDKFEMISSQSPTWYNNSNDFNVRRFHIFINSTMSQASTLMSSSPSSSGGASSSGGGSSGGGSGGSSW